MRGRPLHHQILAVNGLLVLSAVLAATVAARVDLSEISESRQFLVMIAAILATVLANGFLLRRRFAPLEELIATMEAVDLTRPGTRTVPVTADSEDVLRLRAAFNRMLVRLEDERSTAAHAVLQAQERERARLARDLHDEANQSLTCVLLRLAASAQQAPSALAAELRETQAVAADAMHELLRLARELRPTALDDHGLEAATRAHVERFGAETGLATTLEIEAGIDDVLDADGQLVAYRVLQESLTNVVQHAEATSVHVEAWRGNGHVYLRVTDDGQGIDDHARGHGLSGMRERALLGGGRLAIRSTRGAGTVIEVRLDERRPGRPTAADRLAAAVPV